MAYQELFPLVVRERDDATLLFVMDSYERMVHDLEYDDVRNEEYVAWDKLERPVRIATEAKRSAGAWITLTVTSEKPDREGLLRVILDFAQLHGISFEVGSAESCVNALVRLQREIEQ